MFSIILAVLVGIPEICVPNKAQVPAQYIEAVRNAGHTPIILCRTLADAELDKVVSSLGLVLLAGGEDVNPSRYGAERSPFLGTVNEVRDVFEDKVMRAAIRHEVPLFGTCRGAQYLNVFFGGTLYQDLPSEINYTIEHRTGKNYEAARRDHRHTIEIAAESRLASASGVRSAIVNSRHHQAVKNLAPGLKVSAWTFDGVVEAFECNWYPAAGVQFHPEDLYVLNNDAEWVRFYSNLTNFVGVAPRLEPAKRPIGVFDSGIGGLSVLERILVLDEFNNETGEMKPDGIPDFADEDFVYFGDQANMPYGRYDAAGKAEFLRELVVRDAQFVLGSEGHDPSKIVVIACNTATAYGLEQLQKMPRPNDANVIGVVNAGVEAALDVTKNEKSAYAIGVMATPATIASGVYERTIRAALKNSAIPFEVANRGGVGLAEAVENSEPGMRECARTNMVALVEEYRARGGKAPLKALILGCTHYPFVLDVFKETIKELRAKPEYSNLIASDFTFVDPAVYTAISCYRSLRKDGLLKPKGAARMAKRVNVFISVGKNGPLPDAVKYGRDCGCWDLGTKILPLSKAGLSKETLDNIAKSFPACRKEL